MDTPLSKICPDCGMEKPLSEFNNDKNRKYGKSVYCKECKSKHYLKRKGRTEKIIRNDASQDGYKVCARCGNEYPETEEYFGKPRTYHRPNDKVYIYFRSYCIECSRLNKRESAMRYRDTNIKRSREWHANNKDEVNERRRKEYAENPELRESIIEYQKQYQIDNRDIVNAKNRRWHKANPAKRRIHGQNRRARLESVKGELTPELINEVLQESNGLCAYCGRDCSDNWHLDHIRPISKGGTNLKPNLCIACPPCNLSKGDKLLSEWEVPEYISERDLSEYNTWGKPCEWNGIQYPSIRQAALANEVSLSTMSERLLKGYTCDDDMQRRRKR